VSFAEIRPKSEFFRSLPEHIQTVKQRVTTVAIPELPFSNKLVSNAGVLPPGSTSALIEEGALWPIPKNAATWHVPAFRPGTPSIAAPIANKLEPEWKSFASAVTRIAAAT
jgi:hypothetical protein